MLVIIESANSACKSQCQQQMCYRLAIMAFTFSGNGLALYNIFKMFVCWDDEHLNCKCFIQCRVRMHTHHFLLTSKISSSNILMPLLILYIFLKLFFILFLSIFQFICLISFNTYHRNTFTHAMGNKEFRISTLVFFPIIFHALVNSFLGETL